MSPLLIDRDPKVRGGIQRHCGGMIVKMAKAIIEVARALGIAVHDHLIVGKDGHSSLKALKLI
jgi:hypothetical protein